MKRTIYILLILILAATGCKPEAYTGPLAMPSGTWKGVNSIYFFNGETVAEADSCIFPVITFYDRYGYCCVEGVKGEKTYTFNQSTGIIQIDSTLWTADVLTGKEIVMTFIGNLYPAEAADAVKADEGNTDGDIPEDDKNISRDGLELPIEYKGVEINEDSNDYFYIGSDGARVYCHFFGENDESGEIMIDFWYDTHTDRFTPYKPVQKK